MKEAREKGRIRPWDEPAVELALGLARALDAAFRVSDPLLIMKLTGELRVSLASLPLRPGIAGEAVSGGGSGDRTDQAWTELVRASAH